MNGSLGLHGQVRCSVSRQNQDAEECHGDRIPIEQTDSSVNSEVGEKRQVERSFGCQRYAPSDVPQCCSEEHSEENIAEDKHRVPKCLPKPVVHMPADFDRDSSQQ